MKLVSLRTLISAVLLLVLSAISAQASAEAEKESLLEGPNLEAQSPVKAWLELQSSGKAASTQAQPLSGPAMDRVQERYLKNFSHPVPPFFDHVQPIDN